MAFCDFCDIVAKQSDVILAQDDLFIAVKDIQPDFEFHYQIVCKRVHTQLNFHLHK